MKKFLFILFVFFTLTVQSISMSRADTITFGLVDDHLNLVISASDESKTINFYGEVLGLNRISDIELPEKRKMIRYIAGESELKFIIRNKDSSLKESNFNNEIGIQQLTLFIPIDRKKEIIDKILKNNIKLPKFINSKIGSIDISKTLINDFDGNKIELVFLTDELDNYNFNTSGFQLNVTNAKITGSFLRNILGFKYIKNEENQDIFKIGKTLVNLNEVKGSSKKRVGLPGEIEGYSLVQFVVNDVIASRNQILMNGGKILLVTDGVNANLDSLNNKNGFFISSKHTLNLDDQLFKYGLRINSDLIQDIRSTEIPIITGYSNNRPIQEFFKWPYFPLISGNENIISKNIDAISTNFVSSIDTIKNNIKKTILLSSSDKSRIIQTPTKISLSILENQLPTNTFNKKNIPIAVLLSGSFTSVFKDRITPKDKNINFREFSDSTEIIVISDGDIIRNDISSKGFPLPLGYDKYINYTYDGNKKFILNAIQYLSDNDGLINLRSKSLKIRLLNMDLINNYNSLIMILNIFLPVILFILIILTIQFNIRPKYE